MVQPGAHDVEFGLAHRPLETQQEAVVVESWVVDPVAVCDKGAGERADFQELIPVATRPSEPRDLKAHHEANVTEAHLGDKTLEAEPAFHGGARTTKIFVDHQHLWTRPAQRANALGQGVLNLGGLAVMLDLLQR